jgi:site-specific DNA-adenine methylase
MMGSGNILIELAQTHTIIGNDIIPLIPNIYKNFASFLISEEHFKDIINNWKFSEKEHYYIFRDYWNNKYLNNNYDESFLLETFLLLKMCSNSMVRFNQNGKFNQGFRGCRCYEPFFQDKHINKWTISLIRIKNILKEAKTDFYNLDIIKFLQQINIDEKTVFIFDPPYILSKEMYAFDFLKSTEKSIMDFILLNNIKFIYFNFESHEQTVNKQSIDFANKFNTIVLKNKSVAGQNRNKTLMVKEVLITNIN